MYDGINVEVSADVTWDGDDDESGIYLRYVDENKWYYMRIEGDDDVNDVVFLWRSKDGVVTPLIDGELYGVVDINGPLNETHTLTFRAVGDELFGAIDGLAIPQMNPFVDLEPLYFHDGAVIALRRRALFTAAVAGRRPAGVFRPRPPGHRPRPLRRRRHRRR